MIAFVHLASAASLWVAFQGSFGGAVSTRGGARGNEGRPGLADYDIDVTPGVGAAANEGRLNFSLGYAPSLTLRNVGSADHSTGVLHSGFLRLGYSERAFSLSISEGLSIGTYSFRGQRAVPLDPKAVPDPMASTVDFVPVTETAKVFNENTNISAGYRWTPRFQSGLGAGYSITGGRGQSQAFLPQIRTASGDVSVGYTLTTVDTVGGNVAMSNSRTHGGGTPATATTPFVPSPDFQYWSLSLGLNWSHRFSKTTSGALYGGGYGYSTTPQNATTRYTLTVSGGGSFDAQVLQEGRLVVSAGVGVGVGPGVNTITADFQERVQGTGHLNASYEKFHFGVNADATQTIPIVGPHAARLFGAGASVGYSPAKFLDLSAEYRSTWQSIGTGSLGRLWFAFLNVSVVGPPVRF